MPIQPFGSGRSSDRRRARRSSTANGAVEWLGYRASTRRPFSPSFWAGEHDSWRVIRTWTPCSPVFSQKLLNLLEEPVDAEIATTGEDRADRHLGRAVRRLKQLYDSRSGSLRIAAQRKGYRVGS